MIQLNILLLIIGVDITNKTEYKYSDKWNIGIKIFPTAFSSKFFNYVIWDCLIILFVLFEQYILVRYGLWFHTEKEIEDIVEAYDRIAKANSLGDEGRILEYNRLIKKSVDIHKAKESGNDIFGRIKKNLEIGESESFNERLFPKLRVKILNLFLNVFNILIFRIKNQEKISTLVTHYL
jgi:hypothetical protein